MPLNLTEIAHAAEQRIHEMSPNEWFYDNAMLFGVALNDDGNFRDLTLPTESHDVYDLLTDPLTRAEVSDMEVVAVLTCGWAAPMDDGDDIAPSQNPNRRRVRLVITFDRERMVSAARFQDDNAVVWDDQQSGGPLAEVVQHLMPFLKAS